MGLVIGLMADPLRLVFLAFLLAASLDLATKPAMRAMLVCGIIAIAVLIPVVFRPTDLLGPFIIAGLLANVAIMAGYYVVYLYVLKPLADREAA